MCWCVSVCIHQELCVQVCVTSWANCPSEDCSRPRPLFDYVCISVTQSCTIAPVAQFAWAVFCSCGFQTSSIVLLDSFAAAETFLSPSTDLEALVFRSTLSAVRPSLTSLQLPEASSGGLQSRCRNISEAIKSNTGAQSSNQASCSKFHFHFVILGF